MEERRHKHAGATTNTLNFPSIQLANAGTYSVAIANAGGRHQANAVIIVTDSPPDLAAGLLAHLQMNETTGLVAADSTTNGQNATLVNFPGDDLQWVPGRFAGGLNQTNGQYSIIDDSTGALNFGRIPRQRRGKHATSEAEALDALNVRLAEDHWRRIAHSSLPDFAGHIRHYRLHPVGDVTHRAVTAIASIFAKTANHTAIHATSWCKWRSMARR